MNSLWKVYQYIFSSSTSTGGAQHHQTSALTGSGAYRTARVTGSMAAASLPSLTDPHSGSNPFTENICGHCNGNGGEELCMRILPTKSENERFSDLVLKTRHFSTHAAHKPSSTQDELCDEIASFLRKALLESMAYRCPRRIAQWFRMCLMYSEKLTAIGAHSVVMPLFRQCIWYYIVLCVEELALKQMGLASLCIQLRPTSQAAKPSTSYAEWCSHSIVGDPVLDNAAQNIRTLCSYYVQLFTETRFGTTLMFDPIVTYMQTMAEFASGLAKEPNPMWSELLRAELSLDRLIAEANGVSYSRPKTHTSVFLACLLHKRWPVLCTRTGWIGCDLNAVHLHPDLPLEKRINLFILRQQLLPSLLPIAVKSDT